MERGAEHNKYLKLRGRRWWYERYVPKRYRLLDTRGVIRMTLHTTSLEEARIRRDKLAMGHEAYWDGLLLSELDEGGDREKLRAAVEERYQKAQSRALAAGFNYKSVEQLAASDSMVEEVVARVLAVKEVADPRGEPTPKAAEALLGGAKEPDLRVSEAMEVYLDKIAISSLMYKSDHQRRSFKKVKRTSVSLFVQCVGDMLLSELDRAAALKFQQWWADRIDPKKPGEKALTANTANRHISNMRTLYREYYKHVGQEDRANPFRNMHFKQKQKRETPAFPSQWVRTKVLQPGALIGIRAELQLIVYMLIETGCRPSEIINLQPSDIRVDADVPHISIRARTSGKAKREIKTATSEREVPLVGVSLEAARRAPRAFEHYRDKNELFSANVMKAFRNRELFPSPDHKIYSFRHAFEKRMQEANIDFALRCLLMGHKTDRPLYGDGGSLAYRRDELLKIAHPFSSDVFGRFDDACPDWALPH